MKTKVSLEDASQTGVKPVMSINDLSFFYGEKQIIDGSQLNCTRENSVCIVGTFWGRQDYPSYSVYRVYACRRTDRFLSMVKQLLIRHGI